ncbi:Solute-binding protein [subsurface metagenome]
MRRKKLVTLISSVCLILVLAALPFMAACPAPEEEEEGPVILRFAGPWPPLDPVSILFQGMADRFNERAGGDYIMEYHPGEALVKIMESLDAVRTGAVEMAAWPIGVFTSVDPRFAAAEVPFAFNNVNADAYAQELLLPMYSQFMEEEFNSKALTSFTCLALDVCSTKPVKTMDDWENLLVQSVSPQASAFIENMGGSAVPMPFPEGYTSLDKGVVDATMQSSMMMIMFKLNEVASYVTRGYLIPASLVAAINLDTWNSLPENIQDILVEEGLETQREANEFFIGMAEENTKTLTEQGLEVYVLSKAERDEWREAVWPYSEQLIADMGDFGQEFLRIAETVNSKYPYQ